MRNEMSKSEALEMMGRCRTEIMSLRGRLEQVEPKADAYDTLRTVILMAAPRQGGSYSEDLARVLERRIEELKGPEVPPEAFRGAM